jgi:peroxiredoxin
LYAYRPRKRVAACQVQDHDRDRTFGDELFKGKKAVLFAVPGAFTPTCHVKHLPGFVQHAADFKAKGVDLIACTSVNDVFVLDAWAKASGAQGNVIFLADGNGDFAKSIGLKMDGAPSGLGIRLKSLLINWLRSFCCMRVAFS